ncbi:41431_t:CDS:2, partial [Gigaspora margarita]
MSSSEEDTNISASTTDKGKKNIGGHPYGPVWEYFTKGEKVGKGRYKAICNLCGTIWNHGEPIELESYLANYCMKADSIVIRKFLTRILSNILVLDGWTNRKNYSIWKFIIITPEYKEYLYKLSDYSDKIHSEEFLASKIDEVLDSDGVENFSAIV